MRVWVLWRDVSEVLVDLGPSEHVYDVASALDAVHRRGLAAGISTQGRRPNPRYLGLHVTRISAAASDEAAPAAGRA